MILVHFAEGFEEIEALATVDILRRAKIITHMVSVMDSLTVTGAHNIPVLCDMLFEDAPYTDAEMIVLPGGMPGTLNLEKHVGLKEQIATFADQKKVGAICAAPRILGKMELLQNKNAVCYPGNEEFLKGANILNLDTVTDGNITTGRGAGPTMNFALEIVKVLKGENMAKDLASKMLIK